MKKILISVLLVVSLLILNSCYVDISTEPGSLHVIAMANSATVKTVLPEVSMDVEYYVISVSGGITSVSPITIQVSSGNEVIIESLSPSTYDVHADAFNADDVKIAEASGVADVFPGQVTPVPLTVVPLNGVGSVTWEAYWQEHLISNPQWDFQIRGVAEPDYSPLTMVHSNANGYDTLSFAGDFAAGYYVAYGQIKDGEHLVWGAAGIYRILAGETTSVESFEITAAQMNQAGIIGVTLSSDLKDPISVELNPLDSFYISGSTVTAVASTPGEIIDQYIWFINGVPQTEVSDTLTFSPPDGYVRIDCAVISGTDRAGSTSHEFTVGPEPPTAPFIPDSNTVALWHMDGNGIDDSGNGHNLSFSVNSSEYTWSQGIFDESLEMLATQTGNTWRCISTGGFAIPTADFTVEAYIKLQQLPPTKSIVIQQYSPYIAGQDPYRLVVNSSGLLYSNFQIAGTNSNCTAVTADISDRVGDWVHVAFVYRYQSDYSLWVDGVKIDEISTSITPVVTTGHSWYVASQAEWSGDPILIDDLRISDIARY